MRQFLTKLQIQEFAGIRRIREPVTMGIPVPQGMLRDPALLQILDLDRGNLPVQAETLAIWPDGSLKWVLLDFQVSVHPGSVKELELAWDKATVCAQGISPISTKETADRIVIATGEAIFFVNLKTFKPFDRVLVKGIEVLNGEHSQTVLIDEKGREYKPLIKNILIETHGSLRTTLKVEGAFHPSGKPAFISFLARLHFYADKPFARVNFTIHNHRAARHPGGLWDLGDPGSVFFKDLSMHFSLDCKKGSFAEYRINEEGSAHSSQIPVPGAQPMVIYQDSSGGENWMSKNHVNRNGEVKNSFRGYRVYASGRVVETGNRANPTVSITDGKKQVAVALRYFWQNFPKALEAHDGTITARIFPKQYADVFELQAGERKGHDIFIDFGTGAERGPKLEWIRAPLILHAAPEWYEATAALPYFVPETKDSSGELSALTKGAVAGDNSLFKRREIVDEYGWRNFGEFYADHETVGHKGPEPLVSHYNNQYDCIYGALIQFLRNGDIRWFHLADELCGHVKDIDIYHTEADRPEFNHGLFWHTEHYLDAETATHRCFSMRHEKHRNLSSYGGGPSLSHNYSTGFLLHYYLTGDISAKEIVLGLAAYVINNIAIERTVSNQLLTGLKKATHFARNWFWRRSLVQLGKVYSLNGPGRASGNALNTLLDAYRLTEDTKYLDEAENLIAKCIGPEDNIVKRDLLDRENRWMYTVFLQAIGKYLDIKAEHKQFDIAWEYGRQSLVHYAEWMAGNESLYLDNPAQLEYPNETWAAQDVRKCNIFLYASKYSDPAAKGRFLKKASFFINSAIDHLFTFATRTLTRPVALILLNAMMHDYFKNSPEASSVVESPLLLQEPMSYNHFNPRRLIPKVSIKSEIQFLRWRFLSKISKLS